MDVRSRALVGRVSEFGSLVAALGVSAVGEGGLAWVTGEAGVGKSRLVREVAAAAQARGVCVAVGRSVPTNSSSPFRPLAEALLSLLRDREEVVAINELRPWLAALTSIIPILGGGALEEDSSIVRGEAVLRLLRALETHDGLLLVLEDLHWADPDTLAIVEYLADNLTAERVFCIATARDDGPSAALEVARRLSRRGQSLHLALGRLDEAETASMVRSCLPDASDEIVARVQQTADGMPLLIEEILASPGVPRSFTDTVNERLVLFSPEERQVIEAAAVLGRDFDWQLLQPVTRVGPEVVHRALTRGVDSMLLGVVGESFRFRHALTREAVIESLLPPHRVTFAKRALAALSRAHPILDGPVRDLAAELAAQAGDPDRAGRILIDSGKASLARGALATSVATLERASGFVGDGEGCLEVDRTLVEALALSGHVDAAIPVGDRLIAGLRAGGARPSARAEIELRLAQALIASGRWPMAAARLAAATSLLTEDPDESVLARADVLRAEAAFAGGDLDGALQAARRGLESPAAGPEARCHAFELVGRSLRAHDLDAAREAFSCGLTVAEDAGLAVWRLRALHELGTIDLLDHCGAELLEAARLTATELGALSTAAVIELQIAASCTLRFEPDAVAEHAAAALQISKGLGLQQITGLAYWFLAEHHALRGEADEMEQQLARALAVAGHGSEIEGFAWAGGRAVVALLNDDRGAALDALERGITILRTVPSAPGHYHGLWPLLLTATGDPRAGVEINEARRTGADVNRINRGFLAYADAILAGRVSDRTGATALANEADSHLAHYVVWADIARLVAADSAFQDRWGDPAQWLDVASRRLDEKGLTLLAERARRFQGDRSIAKRFGITGRESEVLALVALGLTNKDVAAELGVSARTVEKHLESLLRKTAARSRTQLVAIVRPPAAPSSDDGPEARVRG